MKKVISIQRFLFVLLLVLWNQYGYANVDSITLVKFEKADLSNIKSIDDLSGSIRNIATNRREALELLLLWTEKYMQPDSQRFFNGGITLSVDEAIKSRKGLCDEYCNILGEFCNRSGIKSFRIEGYVKELNPLAQKYDQTNHAWNAVYIDSAWVLCDLFWSTCELKKVDDNFIFRNKIETNFFLSKPDFFLKSHLPVDPLFQFNNAPVSLNDFVNNESLSSVSVTNYNNKDSLEKFLSLDEEGRQLQIARESYKFNKDNPNTLIAIYYNYAVGIYNNPKSKNAEIERAIEFLKVADDLIKTSSVTSIQELSSPIKEALNNLNKRANWNKQRKNK